MMWGFGWGLTLCACACVFFLLSQVSLREAEFLESAIKINNFKELEQRLDTASGLRSLVVTVSGIAGSETPITCKYSDLRGVIVEERVSQEYLHKYDGRWEEKSMLMSSTAQEVPWYLVSQIYLQKYDGRWEHRSELMSSTTKEVPWYLDDGTGRVHIRGAQNAEGLVFTSSGEVYEKSGHSSSDSFLQTVQVLGVKRSESVLPTGTSLTVVGEAVKDNTGTIRIQKPRKGLFYVSRRSIDWLVEDHRTLAWFQKYACVGFIVVGVCLIAMNAIHYIRKMVSRRRVRAAVRQLEQHNEGNWCIVTVSEVSYENVGPRTTARNRENISNIHRLMPDSPRLLENVGSDRAALSGEDNSSRGHLLADDSNLCVICLQHEYNTVFVPCGHLCCCMSCSPCMKSCPLCRRRISQVVRTFRP